MIAWEYIRQENNWCNLLNLWMVEGHP
jgi:hypothetical protein